MESQTETDTTLTFGGRTVVTTPEKMDLAAGTLVIKGEYKGTTHKEHDRQMYYLVRIKVEHELDPEEINLIREADVCTVQYRVPTVTAHPIVLTGRIDTTRPSDPEGVWLTGIEPDYVTFVIVHVASGCHAEMAKLLDQLGSPDLTLEARFVPIQRRLL